MARLANKVVVITGASGALGFSAAKRFVQEGAKVMLVDLNEQALQSCVTELGSEHSAYCVADVTVAKDTQNFIAKTLEKFNRVDIFLANAGIDGGGAALADFDEDTFDKVMAVNVKGVFLGLKYMFPVMEKSGGGSIIISSSVAGLMPSPHYCAYGTSKHAVIGLMKGAACEGGEKNIRVNTVNPSPVESQMMRNIEAGLGGDDVEAVRKEITANIPLGRYAEVEDVTNVMLFLASDESSFVTGSVYRVDGGDAT